MEREQIVKALEHCINRKDCSACVIKNKEPISGCIGRPREFFKNALALINELTEEKERLKADTVRKMQERLKDVFCSDSENIRNTDGYIRYVIDKTAKEMLEEDEGK